MAVKVFNGGVMALSLLMVSCVAPPKMKPETEYVLAMARYAAAKSRDKRYSIKEALWHYANAGTEEALEFLDKALANPDPWIRLNAIWCTYRLPLDESIPRFVRALDDQGNFFGGDIMYCIDVAALHELRRVTGINEYEKRWWKEWWNEIQKVKKEARLSTRDAIIKHTVLQVNNAGTDKERLIWAVRLAFWCPLKGLKILSSLLDSENREVAQKTDRAIAEIVCEPYKTGYGKRWKEWLRRHGFGFGHHEMPSGLFCKEALWHVVNHYAQGSIDYEKYPYESGPYCWNFHKYFLTRSIVELCNLIDSAREPAIKLYAACALRLLGYDFHLDYLERVVDDPTFSQYQQAIQHLLESSRKY